MNQFRISLWLNGICAIRSQPIFGEDADRRIEWWRNVYGMKADIRTEPA